AGAAREIAAGRRARQPAAIGVEPPQIPVLRIERTGHPHALDPFLREDATTAPLTAAQHQEADARLITGMDQDTAAPMRAPRHRRCGCGRSGPASPRARPPTPRSAAADDAR